MWRHRSPTLWLSCFAGAIALAVGALGTVAAYVSHPFMCVALVGMAVFIAAAVLDPRAGLVGLFLSMTLGEPEQLRLGFLVVSPFKIAVAVTLVSLVARHLLWGQQDLLRRVARRLDILDVGAILLWLAVFLSIAVASNPMETLKGGGMTLLVIPLFLLCRRALRHPNGLRVVLWGLVVAAGVFSAYAVTEYARTGYSIAAAGSYQPTVRVQSVFSHPNSLAGFLTLAIPVTLCLGLQYRGWRQVAALGLTALDVAAMLLTYSRTGWIALFGGLAVMAALLPRKLLVAVALPFVVGLGMLVYTGGNEILVVRMTSIGELNRPEVVSRFDYWKAAIDIGESHPVVGVGLGNFPDAYEQLNVPGKWYLPDTSRQPPWSAHSLPLTLFAETGFLGVTALVVLTAGALLVAVRALRTVRPREDFLLAAGLTSSLAAFFLVNITDMSFFQENIAASFWVIVACVAALADYGVSLATNTEAADRVTRRSREGASASRA